MPLGHDEHLRIDAPAAGHRRRSRRARTGKMPRRDRLRGCRVFLRPAGPGPARCQPAHRTGPARRPGRFERIGQKHHALARPALLRSAKGFGQSRRTRPPRTADRIGAQTCRDRHAGHLSFSRHDLQQHPFRETGRDQGRGRGSGAAGLCARFHSGPTAGL